MFLYNLLKQNSMEAFLKKYQIYIATLLSVFAYLVLGYFFERTQFHLLLSLYSLLFLAMIILLKTNEFEKTFFKIGLLFRVLLLFSTPVLSQDFYRFIWDGHAVLSAINPFVNKPDDIINSIENFPNANYLIQKMGSLSSSHYSNYPPINQLFFVISTFIGSKSIVVSTMVLRVIIILADIGIYYFARKILTHFNKSTKNIFWYFLNPLVVLELTGNLHFEGVMMFFLISGLYYLIQNKWIIGALLIALSISTKLLPLLLLPLFLKYFGLRKSILFYTIIIGINGLLFLPFLSSNLIDNYTQTIALWFTNFEFNASVYYIVREIGFFVKGYNVIHIIGQYTPFITVVIVFCFAIFKKNNTIDDIIKNSLLVLTLYLFISTTVHPWYLISLLLLSIFTQFKYALVWSFSILFSYYAYSVIPFQENLWLLLIEYGLVFVFFISEVCLKSNRFSIQSNNSKGFKI